MNNSRISLKALAVATVMMAALGLSGCGGGGSTTANTQPATTTQKRSVVLFPDTTSPISFVVSAPDGTGIVARKESSGVISKLDVTNPDGSFYQLTTGSTGLPVVNTGGYQISVLSADANNKITNISVKDPNGVVTSYGNGISGKASLAASVSKTVSRTVEEICDNPDGTHGLEDNRFPLTYACYITYSFGHPTFVFFGGLADFLEKNAIAVYNLVKGGFNKESIAKAELEIAETLPSVLKAPDNSNGNQTNIAVSPGTPTSIGTDGNSSKSILADAKILGSNPIATNLNTMDASKLQTLDGALVNTPPVSCTAPNVLQNGACVAPTPTPTPSDATKLPAPTNLTATLSTSLFGSFDLSWNAVPGADRYFIYMHKTTPPTVDITKFGQDTTISPVTTNKFHGQNLIGGTYYWVVVAVRNNSAVPLEPQMGTPSAPVSLTLDSTTSTASTASTVTWKITDMCNDGYRIDYKFFDTTANLVWPAMDLTYHTASYNIPIAGMLSCTAGNTICFGGATGSSSWGVGTNGTASCTDCCVSCDGGTHTYNPGCSGTSGSGTTGGTTGGSTGGSTTTTCGTRGVVIPVSLSGGTPNIPTICQNGRENNWVSSLVGSGLSTQALCNQAINPKSEFAKWDSATGGYIYPLINYKNMSGCFCANDATTNKCWTFYDL